MPFFAMEYVPNAKRITTYAEQKKLDNRGKLELFAEVCDAVHHGHQKGIIHRDLKPANILVDSHGQPKIIEQGVQISIRELIDATAERLEEASRGGGRFVDKPLVEGDLRQSIGDRYHELGDYIASERHYRRAVELFQRELGGEHTRALAAERNVANSLRKQGLYDEAERMLGVIIETQRRTLGEDAEEVHRSVWGLAMVMSFSSRYAEADPLAC